MATPLLKHEAGSLARVKEDVDPSIMKIAGSTAVKDSSNYFSKTFSDAP